MIKLSKRSEYALLALSFLRGHAGTASAKDIAEHYHIPQSLLAKVMQSLKKQGLVRAARGVAGGYALDRELDRISFLEFMAIADETTAMVECLSQTDPTCRQLDCCQIRDPIAVLNERLRAQLSAITLAELFEMRADND